MYQQENAFLAYLRESNTLSSSLYQFHDKDSFFIFFTDDKILPRPLFGAINTVAALGQTLYGLLALPFDSGKNLNSGIMGMAMSIPELVFFNIRKGTYQYLPYQLESSANSNNRL